MSKVPSIMLWDTNYHNSAMESLIPNARYSHSRINPPNLDNYNLFNKSIIAELKNTIQEGLVFGSGISTIRPSVTFLQLTRGKIFSPQ